MLRLFSAAFVLPIALAVFDQLTDHSGADPDTWLHFSIAMLVVSHAYQSISAT